MPEVLIRKAKSKLIKRDWVALHSDDEFCDMAFLYINGHERKQHNRYIRVRPQGFWDNMYINCKPGKTYWCCGWGVYSILCKMELGKYSQDGTVNLPISKCVKETKDGMKFEYGRLGRLIAENPPTIIDVGLTNGAKLVFVDLANWGVRKPDFVERDEQLDLDHSIQAIEDLVTMVKELNMGELKTTSASQGWNCYRHSHMKTELWSDSEPAAREVERKAYYAGRNEAYRLGRLDGTVYHLDVNSMYTYICGKERLPVRLVDISFRQRISDLRKSLDRYFCIAEVQISTPEPRYPFRENKLLIYPVGSFNTTLCNDELVDAILTGCVRSVGRVCRYESYCIFDSWSKWYFESLAMIDNLGIGHMRQCLKSIVNATYGKIGQRSKEWVDLPRVTPPHPYDQWWQMAPNGKALIQYRSINGLVQYLDQGGESAISMPSISAAICSAGRCMINSIIEICGKENVYYVDTDGVMVNEAGFCNAQKLLTIDAKKPGALKIREVSNDVEIFGLKHYRFGERYCCAGIPECYYIDEYGKACHDQQVPFAQGLWHKKGFENKVVKRKQARKPYYRHGVVNADGTISPFRVTALE